ncbi:energy transducer TonB [Bradyrhizobium cenepequi]|uniref:energy transducer TonB n=1 Tax=Bradyrhizobium cenepequi TaxID=2821403 RepID=UPI001CE25A1A|nr:energy transducer TonB [Bradyrhizobium cenepequi]MCA6109948.1 energy transducer TonB [Bradyrhizobium cenepequi]
MNAFALHDATDHAALRRWGISALAILAAHAALIAAGMKWYHEQPLPGVTLPAIMVDMAPATSAPQSTPLDLAPGPVMQEANASPPEPVQQQAAEKLIPPTPPQEKPEVVAPPEQKVQPTPPTPEPAKPAPDHKPAPVKPKVVRREAKKPTEAPPAPRTTASPRVERQGPTMSAVSSGASAAAVASYNQIVRAHLLRFKQYPQSAKSAGQQGVASVIFTLSRGGQVTSSRLGRSSGNPALDAEVVAMVRRAQPFPPFPADMKHPAMGFNVPISFSLR